ncbi:MAG: tetratricopeptide repeat protein [Acidobacteriota bacterium]
MVVTHEARAQLAGVETRARGTFAAKGKTAPLEIHALASAGAVPQPMRVLVPMVGRDAELHQIEAALAAARDARGSAIAIRAEAGLGKSRLKYESARCARALGLEVHEGRALSFGGKPYLPLSALLKDALSLPELPARGEILSHVTDAAARLRLKTVDRHHLADVLGARYDESPLVHLEPQDVRLNALIAIRAFARALADEKPRLLVLEDMHWADGASVEAAKWLARAAPGARYALLLLSRPGYEPPVEATELTLGDLADDAVETLLSLHLGTVPAAVVRQVKERAGGNPVYLEEMVRHLVESGVLGATGDGHGLRRELRADDLPESVEAMIRVRLDRLSPDVKKVAQYGAVIGRTFLHDLLSRLQEIEESATAGVQELCRRELIFEQRRHPHLSFIFKHALTRDVAYQSILSGKRRQIHRAVADAVEIVLGAEGFLAMLGHHREHAGQAEEARAAYLAGARQAMALHAHEEAERLYRAYLRLVEQPTQQSIDARCELGYRVLAVRGRTKDAEIELAATLDEARRTGNHAAEAAALRYLGDLYGRTQRRAEARELLEQAAAIARERGDRRLLGIVVAGLGTVARGDGRGAEARDRYQEGLALHRETRDRRSEAVGLGNLAILHYDEGRIEEAIALYEQALAIDREVGNRSDEGHALGNVAAMHEIRGRRDVALALYAEALALDREVGSRRDETFVLGNLANIYQDQGRNEEARRHHELALDSTRETGDRRVEGIVLGNLAGLSMDEGRLEEARDLYVLALAIDREMGDRHAEGVILGNLAYWDLLAARDGTRAAELIDQAEPLLSGVGDAIQIGRLHGIRGFLALAHGGSHAAALARAAEPLAGLEADQGTELRRTVAKLDRAARARDAGQQLLCGHCPEDLTHGQRRWLRERRPDVIPSELMARLQADGTLLA